MNAKVVELKSDRELFSGLKKPEPRMQDVSAELAALRAELGALKKLIAETDKRLVIDHPTDCIFNLGRTPQ